jgi:hypothetical protein
MNSWRQIGTGLIYVLVSVVLVVGGLSLAMAEGRPANIALDSSTPLPSLEPSSTAAVVTPSASLITVTAPLTASASATSEPIIITATALSPSATFYYAYPSPKPPATRPYYPPSVPCGPYTGWVLNYTVQPGDTLYRIANLYRTTVTALQLANCKPTSVIFTGERLWVPNIATITPPPGITLIPTFPTDTPIPTEPLTLTPPPPPTDTPVPTDTAVPTNTTVANP